jgi:transposase
LTKHFKEQAVLRILSGKTNVSKMAEELIVHYSTVRDWVRYYEKDGDNAFPGRGNTKPEDDEI